ncbi:hypothetical protein T4C_8066 [Trichinella pseudospiralis]|uniref:Uncharacterized protein n=1 Tax=Trichinella pseudospiralis TaxID=6337 RepID=A0A0V1K0X1_TRIPS|nr:hypothetical protein T4C_8066 [Trichinella pseudospiralis]
MLPLYVLLRNSSALRYEWNNALFDFSCINYRGMATLALGERIVDLSGSTAFLRFQGALGLNCILHLFISLDAHYFMHHEASTRQARATSFAVHRVRTAEGWIDVYDPPWVKISTANLSVRHVEFEAEKPEVQVLGQRWGTRGRDSRAGGPPPQPKTFF